MKSRKLLPIAFAASALLTGCGGNGEARHNTAPTETTAASNAPDDQAQKVATRMYELAGEDLEKARTDLTERSTLTVIKGVCVGWHTAANDYYVTLNPGWSIRQDTSERFTMFIFSRSATDPEGKLQGPDRTDVQLMNGAEEYGQSDSAGNPIPETHFAQKFNYYNPNTPAAPKVVTVQVAPELAKLPDGEWGMVDAADGQALIHSKSFPGKGAADLGNLCVSMGLAQTN